MKYKLNHLIFFCSHTICCNESVETFIICDLKNKKYYNNEKEEIIYDWEDKYTLISNIYNLDLLFFYRIKFLEKQILEIIQERFPNFIEYQLYKNGPIYYGTTCPKCGKVQEPKITSIQLLADDYWFDEININYPFFLDSCFIDIPFTFFLDNESEFIGIENVELFGFFLNEYSELVNRENVNIIFSKKELYSLVSAFNDLNNQNEKSESDNKKITDLIYKVLHKNKFDLNIVK